MIETSISALSTLAGHYGRIVCDFVSCSFGRRAWNRTLWNEENTQARSTHEIVFRLRLFAMSQETTCRKELSKAPTSTKPNNHLKFAVIYFRRHSAGGASELHTVYMHHTEYECLANVDKSKAHAMYCNGNPKWQLLDHFE